MVEIVGTWFRLRILHLIPRLGGGGAERQLVTLARAHASLGCSVHVAAVRGGPDAELLREAGVSVHLVGAAGNHDPLIFSRLVALVRGVRPNILQTWLPQMDVFGGWAARLTRTPWILSERTNDAAYTGTIKQKLRRWTGMHAAAIVSNSAGGDAYWRSGGGSPNRRFVIPNGIDFEAIASAAPVNPVGSTDDRVPLVLFAGRLIPSKNVDRLIEALALLAPIRRFRAVICGAGPEQGRIAEQIRNASLDDRVELTGYREDLWSVMKSAAVMVSPSLREGHPNVVLEAIACGCPLVVSDIPAHRAFLDPSCATLVDPRDASSLAKAIGDAMDDPRQAVARARAALPRIQPWTVAAAADAYLAVYRDVLRDRRRIRHGRAIDRGNAEQASQLSREESHGAQAAES